MNHLISEFIGFPIVYISPEKKLIYANRTAMNLLELNKETIVASSACCDLLRMDVCKKECPATRIKNNEEVVYDYFVKRENRDAVYCMSTSYICDQTGKRNGILHSIKDMEMVRKLLDDHKKTQEELRHSKLKMQAILESIADGIFSVDTTGRITHFSKCIEKMTGFTEEEALGKRCGTLLRGNACETDCPIEWSIKEGDRVESSEEIIVTKDGRTVPVVVTSAPMRENGSIAGVVCSVHDRTEMENARKELMESAPFPEITGRSKKMLALFSALEGVSDTDVTVLIEGETGTGKEMVARAMHQRSGRNRGPFITVNCSALPLFLLESELFGHVKGSFTGAVKDKKGKFEIADGGTLFLDEIAEINTETQLKLLRFLQSREFERVGDTLTKSVDVRIIAATNKNLKEKVKEGSFREDLFYRLNVFPIKVSPLRERKEDIPLLVEHFMRKHKRLNHAVEGISARALKNLIEYDWPGNVRELENAVMYSMVSFPGKRIGRACLPPDVGKMRAMKGTNEQGCLREDLDAVSIEKTRTMRALASHNWKIDEAADSLGYSRTTLWRRMKKFQIKLPHRNN